jgi:hypothetical protein
MYGLQANDKSTGNTKQILKLNDQVKKLKDECSRLKAYTGYMKVIYIV